MRRLLAVLLILAIVVGCEGPDPHAPPPAEPQSLAEHVCADTTYTRCVEGVTQMAELVSSGTVLAVCEYADGEGDVVIVEDGDTAEAVCSSDGLISPSSVAVVVTVP